MHYINEAHRLIHVSNIGPRALARAADVSPATASAWREGKKKPGTDESRLALERALGIPREAWDMTPGKFQSQGQLELWLALDPRCRRCDGSCTACPVDIESGFVAPPGAA